MKHDLSLNSSPRCLALLGLTLWALAPRGLAELGKYQLILDKQLLGLARAAPATSEAVAPAPASAAWAADYRMTMMTRDLDLQKVRVGLQHLRDHSSLLLVEGEDSHPEFRLESADFAVGVAEIRYQGAAARFELQDGPSLQPPAADPRGRGRGAPTTTRVEVTTSRSGPTSGFVRTPGSSPAGGQVRFPPSLPPPPDSSSIPPPPTEEPEPGESSVPRPMMPMSRENTVQEGLTPPQTTETP